MLAHWAAVALLGAGTAAICLSSIGLLVAATPYVAIHFLGPAGLLGVPLIAASVVVEHGFDSAGTVAALVGVTAILLSPVQAHALARALRIREYGHWIVRPEERPS